MHKILNTALSIALISTLTHAKIYEDGEDSQIDGWRALGNGSILNVEEEGNRRIQLSGESRNNSYILGGTNSLNDKRYKWDAREGKTLSWRMKFEKKPEIYIPIKSIHQSDKIRYIKYISSSDRDESGWNHSGSILTIKVPEKFEGNEWVKIERNIEQDLQAYQHPDDPTQNSLIAINGFMVVGLGMLDDIQVSNDSNDDGVLLISSKIKKTGQTTSYYPKDDGDYQEGISPSYTRDNVKEIVTDNITQLQWQDDEDAKTIKKPWVTQANYNDGNYNNTIGDTATTYCTQLTLGGYNDWRLPTRKELFSILDFSENNTSIDTSKFKNVIAASYWSSTTTANSDMYAWTIYFSSGSMNYGDKDNNVNYYVRCVREGE